LIRSVHSTCNQPAQSQLDCPWCALIVQPHSRGRRVSLSIPLCIVPRRCRSTLSTISSATLHTMQQTTTDTLVHHSADIPRVFCFPAWI
jgi:hypothetical protein